MGAKLLVKAGLTDKKEYALEAGKAYVIGRSREADIIVKDQQSSRRHCKLEAAPDGQWTLTDQNSSNGTFVNHHRVTTHPLRVGDLVQVGRATFEFELPSAATVPAVLPERAAPSPAEPAAPVRPAPQPEPVPAELPASPVPAPAAKPAASDRDLQDLFAFLDRVEASDKPAAPKEPPAKAEERPAFAELPAARPAPAPPEKKPEDEDVPFLTLLEETDHAQPEPKKPEMPPEPPKKERGGLLAFLRKKKPP